MEIFHELGTKIANEWHKHSYDIEVFSSIAQDYLTTTKLDGIDPDDICNWVINTNELPKQFNLEKTFGEPPVTVFTHEKFYIEILFWVTSTTAIHQHGFRGVFYVLSGSSIHSIFQFHEQKR